MLFFIGQFESLLECMNIPDLSIRFIDHLVVVCCIFSSRSRWGCQITDIGLYRISLAKCISNLTSISIWGITGITDKGVVQLVCDYV